MSSSPFWLGSAVSCALALSFLTGCGDGPRSDVADDASALDDGGTAADPDAAARDSGSGDDSGVHPRTDGGDDAGSHVRDDAGTEPVVDGGNDTDAAVAVDGGDGADAGPGVDAGENTAVDSGAQVGDASADAGSLPVPEPDAGGDAGQEDDGVEEETEPEAPWPRPCAVEVDVGASMPNPEFAAEATELTSWTTHQGNSAHDGWVPLALHPDRFQPRWTFEDHGRQLSEVTTDHGVVAVSTGAESRYGFPGKVMHALSVARGRVLWTHNAVLGHVGPPAISDGVVYAQVGAQNWSHVTAFDVRDGARLWSAQFDSQWPSYLAPTIDGDGVFVGGGMYGGMYAYERSTGAQRWFVDMDQQDGFTPTPRAHDVFAMVSSTLTVVDRESGEVLQTIKHPTLTSHSSGAVAVQATPSVIVAVGRKTLFAFDLEAANVRWSLPGEFHGQPVVAAGTLYVANGAALEARDPSTGGLLWQWSPGLGQVGSRIVVTDNLAFVTTESATHAVDLASHEAVWSHPEAGKLALGQGTLFISGLTRLTAIDLLGDGDTDGLPDWWELHHAGGDVDPTEDPDGDGLANAGELAQDTLPGCADTDGDTVVDGVEVELSLAATDPDTDSDALLDGAEVALHGSDPKRQDTDGDGVADDIEVKAGFDPNSALDAVADDDRDGYVNAHELLTRADARDPRVVPRPSAWAMHQGNARHDGYQSLWLDSARFGPAWTQTVDDDIVGVALGERHVALTTQLTTAVFDADDGQLRWRHTAHHLDRDGWDWAQHSAPSLYRGAVYVHSAESVAATLWVRDARTGVLRYRSHHGTQESSYLAPTLFDGRVHMNGGYYGGLATLDAATGTELWWSEAPMEGPWEPAVTRDGVWLVERGSLRVLNRADGTNRQVERIFLPYRTPVVDRQARGYFAGAYWGADDELTSVELRSGLERWHAEHGPTGTRGEPAVGNTRVYSVRAGVLEVHHAVHGRLQWRWQPEQEMLTSNVVVTATHAFVASAEATYAVDLRTQTATYRHPFGGQLALGGEARLAVFSGPRIDILTLEGDVDGDGIAEWWERSQGGDVSADEDADGDGLTALDEYNTECDPGHPDSDRDGVSDGDEIELGTLPLNPDSDHDTLDDHRELNDIGSDPTRADGDADGLPDAVELNAGLDPSAADDAAADLDGDGFSNRHEALAGSGVGDAASVPALHDWAMFRGGPDHASAQPVLLDPARFELAWSVELSSTPPRYCSDPAINRDYLFVTVDDTLRALALANGAEAWRTTVPGGIYTSNLSAPSIGQDMVYVHTGGTDTAIWGFDQTDGRQVFRTPHASQNHRYMAPTLADGILVAPAGMHSGMIAVDATDGTKLWQLSTGPYDVNEPALRDGRAIWVYQSVMGYDAFTGSSLYSVQPRERLERTTGAITQSGLLVAGENEALGTFDVIDGVERWRVPSTGRKFGLPALAGGRIYAVRYGLLEVFDETDGRWLWSWQPEQEPLLESSIVVSATHVLVSGRAATYAVDLHTHEQSWQYPAAGQLSLSAEGVLVIHDKNHLTVLRMDDVP